MITKEQIESRLPKGRFSINRVDIYLDQINKAMKSGGSNCSTFGRYRAIQVLDTSYKNILGFHPGWSYVVDLETNEILHDCESLHMAEGVSQNMSIDELRAKRAKISLQSLALKTRIPEPVTQDEDGYFIKFHNITIRPTQDEFEIEGKPGSYTLTEIVGVIKAIKSGAVLSQTSTFSDTSSVAA